MQLTNTPAEQGYYFPAEWEEHASTWLTYPKPNESWPENFDAVCEEYNQFVNKVSSCELVNIICDSVEHEQFIADKLDALGACIDNIKFHHFGSNDSWCRDHGPAFLKHKTSSQKALVKWEFNAWGNKYPAELDNEIGNKIALQYKLPVFRPGIFMEGGSIEVNGKGSLLTTRSCLQNTNRNADLSPSEIETYLKAYYGVDSVFWLDDGVEGDDTDGHIDDISRFVDAEKIITAIEDDKNDPNYSILKKNAQSLSNFILENGKNPEVIELPMPKPMYFNGDRLPASYANFYICNRGVIVPVFGTKTDDKALQIIQSCFPKRDIIGLMSKNIIYGLGSWHCLSQQEVK